MSFNANPMMNMQQGMQPQKMGGGMNPQMGGGMNPQARGGPSPMQVQPLLTQVATTDLMRLGQAMQAYEQMGGRFHTVHYTVNWWDYNEWWLPLKHHGLLLEGNSGHMLSLDFGTAGLNWDFDSQKPQFSKYTNKLEIYQIDVRPTMISHYANSAPEFSYLGNDCNAWTKGFLKDVCQLGEDKRHRRVHKQSALCSVDI